MLIQVDPIIKCDIYENTLKLELKYSKNVMIIVLLTFCQAKIPKLLVTF